MAIVAIALMHVYQSWLMYKNVAALGATNLTAVLLAFRFNHLANGMAYMQLMMCAAAALALFGAFCRLGWVRIVIFIPQHLILGAMAWGGVYAAHVGHYLDKTPMAWSHISADQFGYVALFVVHSSAIVRRCRDPNG